MKTKKMFQLFLENVALDWPEELDALRQYLHGMVACLDNEIFDALPVIFQKYIAASPNLKVMQDFLVLLQQIFTKYKVDKLFYCIHLL